MLELTIIKCLLNKHFYDKYRRFIEVSRELKPLYDILDDIHHDLNRDILFGEYKYLVLQKDPEQLSKLEIVENEEVGHDVADKLIKTLCEQQWAHKLALLSISVFEGTKDVSELNEHYLSYSGIETSIENIEQFVTDDLHLLENSVAGIDGIKWRLPALQRDIGSLNKGVFGFIFARPETGKTTFLASEVTHFSGQVETPIIWFNNEEPGNKVKSRIYQAALGITQQELYANKEINMRNFLTLTKGNIKLVDNGYIHKKDVEAQMKELRPSLVVFDQIDKIKGFKADREDLLLGAIYIWARELAKEYCPIIGVCQASASAENKKWLTSEDIAKSKTEKLAEGDFIIGIGKTHDVGMEEIRYLNLIKNKLTGVHSRIECRIVPQIARYKEI